MNSKKNELSAKQTQILSVIKQKVKESGYPPTVREIATAVNLSSSATIHMHLKKLENLGYIKRDPKKNRAIELIQSISRQNTTSSESNYGENNIIFVPVVGRIAAGSPILAEENIEDYFPLSSDFAKGTDDIFMLRVKGESMINAGILDKDYLIMRKQETAMNGEIVAALIDDEATVKRFFKKANSIKLMPENDFMEPIEVKDVKILGKVIGVIRKYF